MRVASSALLGVALAGLACADEGPAIVVTVELDAGLVVPDDVDALRVEATSSRRDTTEACEPLLFERALEARSDLPLRLRFFRGAVYREWFAVRVTASRGAAPVLRRSTRRAWPDEGEAEVAVDLEAVCLGELCTDDATFECVDGACRDSAAGVLFEREEWAEPCEPD
jgi:hypothetical protein